MRYIVLIIISLLVVNCNTTQSEDLSAQAIIDTSIEAVGGTKIESSIISFKFRNLEYAAKRSKGIFAFSRQKIDSSSGTVQLIKDVLSNSGFERFLNDSIVEVPDTMATKYSASVNSVHYFSVLPYGLNDAAVIKEKLADTRINDTMYYTIRVTFKEEGGGEDFEDEFLYWIDKETFKLQYLAYSYNEDDGKGMRFREAYNERLIEGVRFVDYNNYKPKSEAIKLPELPTLFESGQLDLVSKIELNEINVN